MVWTFNIPFIFDEDGEFGDDIFIWLVRYLPKPSFLFQWTASATFASKVTVGGGGLLDDRLQWHPATVIAGALTIPERIVIWGLIVSWPLADDDVVYVQRRKLFVIHRFKFVLSELLFLGAIVEGDIVRQIQVVREQE